MFRPVAAYSLSQLCDRLKIFNLTNHFEYFISINIGGECLSYLLLLLFSSVCLLSSALAISSSWETYVRGLMMWLCSRVNQHLWQFKLLIRESWETFELLVERWGRNKVETVCCRSHVSLEGDIINYQLRILPSKQINQNRKLTEQNRQKLPAFEKWVNERRNSQ